MIPNLDIEYVTVRKKKKKVAMVYLFFADGRARNCLVCKKEGREKIVVVLQIVSPKGEIPLGSEKGKEIIQYVQKDLLHGFGLCWTKTFFGYSSCEGKYLNMVSFSELWK